MSQERKSLGRWGEEKAEKYLFQNNYEILERNHRNYFGEIDIISKKKQIIYFIEVKTRTNLSFGFPEEAVNYKKQQKLILASRQYMKSKKLINNYQIDVIAIERNDNTGLFNLRHIRNAVNYFN